MVSAVILLVVEKDKVNEVAERMVDLKGITEVYSVAGQYDLVAIARVKDNEAIADAVTRQMLKIDGIIRSETLLAFRVFSRYDLERIFSIGADEPAEVGRRGPLNRFASAAALRLLEDQRGQGVVVAAEVVGARQHLGLAEGGGDLRAEAVASPCCRRGRGPADARRAS